jgi:tetratricopeptide (TPR) repeat protein
LRRAIAAYEEGDMQRALEGLQSMGALTNTHDSAVRSLYLGLVYFALGDRARATDSFGRAVRTEPPLRLDPTVHSPTRVAAFEEAKQEVVREWRTAAQQADATGDEAESLRLWRTVLSAAPEDAQAASRVEAIRDAQRIRSDSAAAARLDSLARAPVRPAAVDSVRRPAEPERYSPGQAFAMGLVVPGLGQLYAGRGLRGVLALAGAGGALAAGYLMQKVDVNCRTEPVNNTCPAADVLDENTRRPYLTAAVAAAAGIAIAGAIDGMLSARRANARSDAARGSGSPSPGLRLEAPAVTAQGDQVRAEILRLRFR